MLGVSILMVFFYIFTFIVITALPILLDTAMNIEGTFLFIGLITLVNSIIICFFLKETRGLSHNEIDALYY